IRDSPSFVTVTFDREGQKLVTVDEPQIIGRPLLGRVRVSYEPRHITVRGPRSRLEELVSLPTEPVDVEGRVESFTQNLRVLVPSDKGILEVRPAEVRARIEIDVEMTRREFTNMQVLAAMPPGFTSRVILEPSTVKLILRGRADVLEGLAANAVNVFVTCSATDTVGSVELPVRVSLPSGIEVGVEVIPPTVQVRLEENLKR
ncbi:MAG: CdaR family protein, partial [Kiritimatiellae bacterium]|nr:CdaR family protein [Kiritimatiellia bacterium]